MTVRELKEILDQFDDEIEVKVCDLSNDDNEQFNFVEIKSVDPIVDIVSINFESQP